MNEKLKENYYAPTPKKWRKIGDSLLGISAMLMTFLPYAQAEELRMVIITAAVAGIAGKVLTNFFTE